MPVRIAKPEDRKEIWRLFLACHNENGMFDYDPQKVAWWFDRLLEPGKIPEWDTGPRGIAGVIGEVGNLEAGAILIFGSYWYAAQKHLEELVVYCCPEYRTKGHTKELLKWMKWQSEITGLPLLCGILTNTRLEAKVRLYERFLPRTGAFFLYKPNGMCDKAAGSA